MLTKVSITGADDKVDIAHLARLSRKYDLAEWAILYFPEREGTPRNPSAAWRDRFLSSGLPQSAAHLCGERVFRDLLANAEGQRRLVDLARFSRIQLNINARHKIFTEPEVRAVYRRLLDAGMTIIVQYHRDSMPLIDDLLLHASCDERARIHVLFDASRGTGIQPDHWAAPLRIDNENLCCGYAGGLGPAVLDAQLPAIERAAAGTNYWIDMETGVRTDNAFDLDKVERVLHIAQRMLEPEALGQ